MTGTSLITTQAWAVPEGTVPEWVQLAPAGTFSGQDGRGPYRLRDPQAVIAASLAGGRIPIDENHATDLLAPKGEPSPARGWIVGMEARADGLWGRVEWTPSGRTLLTERAYRGISPVFATDPNGTVHRILRAALTNTPNLPQLATLNSAGHEGDFLTDTDRMVCAKMGIEPQALAAHKRKLTATAQSDGLDLTPGERMVCQKMNIDPAEFAKHKRLPKSAYDLRT